MSDSHSLLSATDALLNTTTTDRTSLCSSEQDQSEDRTSSLIVSRQSLNDIIRKEVNLYIKNLNLTEIFVTRSDLNEFERIYYENQRPLAGRSISEVVSNYYLSDCANENLFSLKRRGSYDLSRSRNYNDDLCNYKELLFDVTQTQQNDKTKQSENLSNCKDCNAQVGDTICNNDQHTKPQSKSIKSTEIMYSFIEKFNNKDSDSTSITPIYEQTENSSLLCLKNFNSRLSELELHVMSLRNLIHRAILMKQRNKRKRPAFSKCNLHKIKINTNFTTDNVKIQYKFDNKKNESDTKESKTVKMIKSSNKNCLHKTKSQLGQNYYDQLFYESREYQMNLCHYKKSEPSLLLNYIPKLPELDEQLPKFCNGCVKLKKSKWPVFRLTPSREKLNKI